MAAATVSDRRLVKADKGGMVYIINCSAADSNNTINLPGANFVETAIFFYSTSRTGATIVGNQATIGAVAGGPVVGTLLPFAR